MKTVSVFEDILDHLNRHEVRYLVIGGLAFIYHAKPRFTKDIDLWIDPEPENVQRANAAIKEFGGPFLLDAQRLDQFVQLGIEPNRIDLMLQVDGPEFKTAWQKRVEGTYGSAKAIWIDIHTLIDIKKRLDNPRHQEDVRVLRKLLKRREAKN